MISWTALLILLYLSSNYVEMYRFLNFGPNNAKPFISRLLQNERPVINCYLNYHWSQCPVMPTDLILKMLANSHSNGGIRSRDRYMLHKPIYGDIREHSRIVRPANIASPLPTFPPPLLRQNTPLSWQPNLKTLNENLFKITLYPTMTTTPNPLMANSLGKFLGNHDINNNHALADTLLRWHAVNNPEHSAANNGEPVENAYGSVSSTSDPTFYENTTAESAKSDPNIDSFSEEGIETVSLSSGLASHSVNTAVPINTTPLIYDVQIEVSTKSDETSFQKNVTINAISKIPKKLSGATDMSSRNPFMEFTEDRNRNLSVTTHNKSAISRRTNNFIPNLAPEEIEEQRRNNIFNTYSVALDALERKFYAITFNKLTSISPEDRRENGISFVQSGLFLSLQLMAYSTETDDETTEQIDQFLGLNLTYTDKIYITKYLISKLPQSNFHLKWRWSSRLVLGKNQTVSETFRHEVAPALNLTLTQFYGNETKEEIAGELNHMIEKDSGGAIRNTFEPNELVEGVRAVGLTTLYMRGRWRSAPTVLNGSRLFRDADGAPPRTVRMIRINDYMRYANFQDWRFQAIEIFYATRGLSLLILVPNGRSLRELASLMETVRLAEITGRMITMRAAVTMPLYTLRMTLLLPSKLQALGIEKLISISNATDSGKLKLSHAVQRLMFWAEAGRNAFKDDGIEWDPEPELELVVDRPYLFFVRWNNITLMNGNFVL